MDYIFFLYGLAFIILAAICTTLSRSDSQVLPWRWLKYFALIHGLSEWLDMAALGAGDVAAFGAFRPWVMLVSFMFLVEFGREGVLKFRGIGPGRWIHLPLLAFVGLGAWGGVSGIAAAARYAYGLVGAVWAAAAFLAASGSTENGRRALKAGAFFMALYALAAGLVVSRADLFPAATLNQEAFQSLTGIPIQLIRGSLAACMAVSIWNYRRVSEQGRLSSSFKYRRCGLQFALLLGVTALGGWVLTEAVGNYEETRARAELVSHARTVAMMLDRESLRGLSHAELPSGEPRLRLVQSQLAKLTASSPDLKRLGLLIVRNGRLASVIELGTQCPAQAEPQLAGYFGRRLGQHGPVQGTAGPWRFKDERVMCAYTQVLDPASNELLGVAFAETDAAEFAREIALHRSAPIGMTLMASLLIVGFFVLRRASDALRESEENLAVTLHSIGDAVLTVDTFGRVSRLNPVAEQLTGWSQEKAQGRRIEEVFHILQEQSRQPATIPVDTVLRSGKAAVLDANTLLVARDGTERCIADSAAPIRDSLGRLIGVVLVFRDITQEQRSREALRRSEAEARTLALVAARTDNGVVLADPSGRVEWVNQGFTRISGYTLEEVRGKKPGSVLQGAETSPATVAQMHRALLQKTGFKVEVVNFTKQGRKYWVSVEVQPLLDQEGRLAHFMGLQSDITERKRAEEEIRQFNSQLEERVEQRTSQLRESEQRLAQIIDFLPDATLAVDRNGVVLAWNRAIEKLTGVPAREVVGKGNHHYGLALYKSPRPLLLDYVLYPDKPQENFHRAVEREGDMVTGEAEFVLDDKRWVLWGKASPLYDSEGNVVGAIESIRDVTERKDLEQQLRQAQKMEGIGQLAGGVAHDFNNLLSVILGNGEMALGFSQKTGGPATDCLKQVVAAANRAANLTRQLLAFSRKQVMQVESVNLGAVVANLTKMLKRIIGENIELQCEAAADLPLIDADTGMMEQVLVNLVVNARDAMPEGGRLQLTTERVHLETRDCPSSAQARPGDYVCLSVADTGQGIAPEDLGRIFEPFFTTKPVGKGTGLGLATVYGIVKQHLGWVDVASRVGVGTVFKIYLPVQTSAKAAAAAAPLETSAPGGRETILLVEDEEAVRGMLRRLLESRGYLVREAASGRQAVEGWSDRSAEIDLLLTDIVMPDGVNGRELARTLRRNQPQLKVLFMSGYSDEATGIDSDPELQPHSRFQQKPCSSGVLLQQVRQCLDAS